MDRFIGRPHEGVEVEAPQIYVRPHPIRKRWPGGRRWLLGLAAVGALAALVWAVFFATWEPQQKGQVRVVDSAGSVHTFTVCYAQPLLPLPMAADNPHGYVRYGERTFTIHGNAPFTRVGPVFVSPDRRQVLLSRSDEGNLHGHLCVHLTTGQARRVDGSARDYERAGWQRVDWVRR